MSFLNKMEKKFGKYAIPNLMYYIVILYALGIFVRYFAPEVYFEYLMLDASKLLRGQIWRIATFLMWPLDNNVLLNILVMYCYYNIGRTLEYIWGSFKFNVYIFMGVLGHALAAVIVYLLTSKVYLMTADYLNLSLFFAYAATFPDQHFLLFYVIPVKAKWLALFDAAFFVYSFVFGGITTKITVAMSLLNFLIYFAMLKGGRYNPKEIKRKQQFKTQVTQVKMQAASEPRHRCAVCGRTEKDDPNLTFRYCSKCDGDYEYCQDHLYTHEHVKKSNVIDMENH